MGSLKTGDITSVTNIKFRSILFRGTPDILHRIDCIHPVY